MQQPIGGGTNIYTAYPTTSGTNPNYRTPLGSLTPGQFFQQAMGAVHTSNPDYAAIIDRLMAPIRAANEAKLKALGISTDLQKNLANENARLQQEQLAQVHKRALKTIVNNLTGRGLGQSGEKPYQVDFENDTFDRATKLAANQLLAYLMNLEDQLKNAALDASSQEQSSLLSAQQYAAANYSPNIHHNPWETRTTTVGV